MASSVVPEATEDRVRNAQDLEGALIQQTSEPGIFVEDDRSLTPAQIAAISKQRAAELKAANNNGRRCMELICCSRTARFFAKLIDGILSAMALGLSCGIGVMLASAGYYEMPKLEELVNYTSLDPFVFLGFVTLFFLFNLLQWCLIANLGQSLGKMVFNIKIVDEHGFAPGFFQGVFLRTWVMGLINSFIPFGGLVDSLLIFRDPPRCGHDQLAKTWVVSGSKL
jgi:uncharacterized RDD family membrane protein YckC